MCYLNLDYAIVFIFLLITLVIGIIAGRNTKTLQDYALANRIYSTTTLVITYLATDIGGGSVFSDAASVFARGIIVNVSISSLIIAFIIRAIFIAPKIVYFKNCLTMGEVMGNLYGTSARILTGILGCFNATILAGIQLIALGIICEALLGIRATYGIIIGSVFITFYATWGGIKAITLTDVFQFFVLIVFIPLIAIAALKEVGGMQELFIKSPAEKFIIRGHERFYRYLTYFFIWIFQLGMMDIAVVQRMLMASSKHTLRNKYLIIACFDPIFRCIVMLIGLAGYVLYPSIEAKWIVPHMVQTLLPVGLKGLVIAGLLAVVMSSADSYVHAAGLTFTHDIVRPFFKKKFDAFNALSWVRYATVCVGFFATMIGIAAVDISYWGFKALELIGPMLMFPFVSGVIGLKPEKKAFFIALVCTFIAFIIATLLLPDIYSPLAILISTIINGITFFGTHLWIYKGFKMVERRIEKHLNEYTPPRSFLKDLFPKNILAYVQKQLQVHEAPYVLAGIFCLLNLVMPHFIWVNIIKAHPTCLLVVHTIGAVLSVLLIAKDKWSTTFQVKYMPSLLYLTLLYCLPFSSTMMCIISRGDVSCMTNLLLAITLLVVLVDGKMVILLSVLAIALNLLLYPYFGPIDWAWQWYTPVRLAIYQPLLTLLVGIYFVRRKQKQIHQLEQQQQQLCKSHMLCEIDYLHSLQYQALGKKWLELQKEPLRLTKQALRSLASHSSEGHLAQKGLEQLDAFIAYCKANFYQTMDTLRLDISTIPLTDLLVQLNSQINNAERSERIHIQLLTKQKTMICDVEKIVQLLTRQIQALLRETTSTPTLSIQDTQLSYHLQAVANKDYSRRLPALGFLLTQVSNPEYIQPCYPGTTVPVSLEVPKTAIELPERNQNRLIEAHYGYQERINTPLGASRLYVFPQEINKIRAGIVDKDPIPREVPLDNHASSALERIFIQRLLETDCLLDLAIVREAIDMIKQAHQGQFRKSGELFYTHPLNVATILLTMTQDPDTVLAALLHDVVEDTPLHLEQLAYQYGQRVAWLVQKVTHLDPTGKKAKLTQEETHEQLAAALDEHAVMIKLADRLHNIRTLDFQPLVKQRRIAQETLDFYLPLGHSIKCSDVKQVVEELTTRCQMLLQR